MRPSPRTEKEQNYQGIPPKIFSLCPEDSLCGRSARRALKRGRVLNGLAARVQLVLFPISPMPDRPSDNPNPHLDLGIRRPSR